MAEDERESKTKGCGGGFAARIGGDNRGAGERRGSTSQMSRRAQRAGREQGKAPPSSWGFAGRFRAMVREHLSKKGRVGAARRADPRFRRRSRRCSNGSPLPIWEGPRMAEDERESKTMGCGGRLRRKNGTATASHPYLRYSMGAFAPRVRGLTRRSESAESIPGKIPVTTG